MIRKIFVFLVLISGIFFNQEAHAKQNAITITGETCVIPQSGLEYIYTVSGANLTNIATFQWCVAGGIIVPSGGTCLTGTAQIKVVWNSQIGAGDISFSENGAVPVHKAISILNINDGGTISPGSQIVVYNTTSFQLTCTAPFGGGGCGIALNYQWEISNSLNGPFASISGATSQNYLSPPITQSKYYRRVTSVYYNGNNYSYYSNTALAEIPALDPGIIKTTPVQYNTIPVVSSFTPATGGFCFPSSYIYQWQQSVENGPWTVFGGNTVDFPTNAQAIIGSTRIRRKITCGTESKYSNTLTITPNYSSADYENLNYVRTYTVATKGVQSWYQADQLEIGKKFQETVYFDGLGRTIETVNKGISAPSDNMWKDVVLFNTYDQKGRPSANYLPYPTNTNPGKFKPISTTELSTFYTTNYGESSPWGATIFEQSPLDRVSKVIDPGYNRQAFNINTSMGYDFNNSNGIDEKVHIWSIDYTPGSLPNTSAVNVYAAGTLIKTVVTDVNSDKVIEYKDLLGNVILKKVQLKNAGNDLTDEHSGWLCTYYVYDDFNRLRFIITPKAVTYLDTHNWSLTQEIADELCFYTEYDTKGRTIISKKPGSQRQQFVYDQRNRVVFTQDGNQAAKSTKEWLVTIYDDQDRVEVTGIYKTPKTRDQLASEMSTNSGPTTITIPGEPVERVIVSQRETTSPPNRYAATKNVEVVTEFTSNNNDEFTLEIDPSLTTPSQTITVYAVGQVNVSDPSVFSALSYHYYDNYNFPRVKSFDNSFTNTQAYSNNDPDILPIIKTNRALSMPTGSKVRVLNSDIFLLSTIYYDEDGQAIQTLGDNYKGGTDVVTTQYHFDGRVMSTYSKNSVPGSAFNNFGILTKNIYDKIGRATSLVKKFGAADFKTLSEYTYNALGQVQSKKIGRKPNTTDQPLETLNYSYNVYGHLTGINKDYALSQDDAAQWDKYFGLTIGYDIPSEGFLNGRFDHLITNLTWKTQGDNTPRKYSFTYDRAGRLTASNYVQKTKPSETTWANGTIDFSENDIQYDENGNLKQLYRKGILPGTNTPLYIDKLKYTYKQIAGGDWSNQLKKVLDDNPGLNAATNGKLGDFKDEVFNSDTDDYNYDANGNLVVDNNKKIRVGTGNGITYNFLDKPEKIVIEGKSTVEFIYDAVGIKLAKKVTPVNGTTKTTFYLGEFIYQDDELEYILHEEGRVRVMTPVNSTSPLGASALILTGNIQLTADKWGVFDYFIKDHLGSVRMVLTEELHKEIYKATMENAAAPEEERIFGQVDANGSPLHPGNEVYNTRISKPGGWTSNTQGALVSKLFTTSNYSGNAIGPNVLLKVMGGDNLSAKTDYYYESTTPPLTNYDITSNIINTLLGGFGGGAVSDIAKNQAGAIQSSLVGGLNPFMTTKRPVPASGGVPKAYLNYIFFDESFNPITDASGAILVGTNTQSSITVSTLKAPRNGYAYIYLSNESSLAVYFDEFQVSHERGAIIEETHYYPHGLKIVSLCSKAYNKLPNKYTYQGDFSEEETETGYDEFDLRLYDPQIGRWMQSDPYNEFASGYIGMGNDPVNNIDPTGGYIDGGLWMLNITGAIQGISNYIKYGAGIKWDILPTCLVSAKSSKKVPSLSFVQRVKLFTIGDPNLASAAAFTIGLGDWIGSTATTAYKAMPVSWILASSEQRKERFNSMIQSSRTFWQFSILPSAVQGQIISNGVSNAYLNFVNADNFDRTRTIGSIIPDIVIGAKGLSSVRTVGGIAAKGTTKVKYIGTLVDLEGVPRSQTFSNELAIDLGSTKANYYRNMSVIRKARRDGYSILDYSWRRPNSELAPTIKRPNRNIGQTFLGAERLALKSRGIYRITL